MERYRAWVDKVFEEMRARDPRYEDRRADYAFRGTWRTLRAALFELWMHRNAQLEGKLGKVMALLYEIKVNGLEGLLGELSREDIARLGEQVERGR